MPGGPSIPGGSETAFSLYASEVALQKPSPEHSQPPKKKRRKGPVVAAVLAAAAVLGVAGYFIAVAALPAPPAGLDYTADSISGATVTGYSGKSGTLVIPADIDGTPTITIGDKAFAGNTVLTSLTIPKSVTAIGTYAFLNCSGLKVIYFQGDAPQVVPGAFGGASPDLVVYHRVGAKGWSNPWSGIPTKTY